MHVFSGVILRVLLKGWLRESRECSPVTTSNNVRLGLTNQLKNDQEYRGNGGEMAKEVASRISDIYPAQCFHSVRSQHRKVDDHVPISAWVCGIQLTKHLEDFPSDLPIQARQ